VLNLALRNGSSELASTAAVPPERTVLN
jgi:hypothetical protein